MHLAEVALSSSGTTIANSFNQIAMTIDISQKYITTFTNNSR
jgi:hypothetical protein